MTKSLLLASAILLAGVSPAFGQAQAATVAAPATAAVPVQLGPNARERYRDIFASIRGGQWADATAKLDAMDSGPLHQVARALIYTGKGSPKVEAEALVALAAQAPDLPQAPALVRLAESRGALTVPLLPPTRNLAWLGTSPRRGRVSSENDPIATDILPLIKEDRPYEAEAILILKGDELSASSLAEWQQRVAWSHFLGGDDAAARALAAQASAGSGEWGAQADWVMGLAAWRQKDFKAASNAFTSVARRSTDAEMIAAGHYWASRADTAAQQPDRVQPHLRSAAKLDETFYGMLAQAALGLAPAKNEDGQAALRAVADNANVQAAIALSEIGETERADEMIRWQAKIGVPAEHAALATVAGKIGLPQTQLYLAHNGPSGARVANMSRYPFPANWSPDGGWRVDKALVFAHALQESRFNANVTSPAGARGLMQVMPGTAAMISRRKGEAAVGTLSSPSTNMEYGQSYIEQLRDMGATGGLLPKVIMAYNCGPAPLERWNARDETTLKDPLLYIESIPYWETRGYVTIVMRNYWMYQTQTGAPTVSRTALVQGQWPRFPGVGNQAGRAVASR